jgi:hypothetical protein
VIVFDPIDKDGNGTLDVQEVGAKITAMSANTSLVELVKRIMCIDIDPAELEKSCKAIMEAMDTNGDGVISFDEFVAAIVRASAIKDENAIAAGFHIHGPKTKEEYDEMIGLLKTTFAPT